MDELCSEGCQVKECSMRTLWGNKDCNGVPNSVCIPIIREVVRLADEPNQYGFYDALKNITTTGVNIYKGDAR